MYNSFMVLKPQDVLVLLKLGIHRSNRPSLAQMATELGMSSSEVHAAMNRARIAGLLHGSELQNRPNISALEEFLIHGLKYAFPAERGGISRGIPTSYAAEPLSHFISPGSEPIPVWPYAEGSSRGVALTPLYKSVPIAALRDPLLYEQLALIDALREGRARERKLAEQELIKRLR
jgi:hypothetical protein